MGAHMRHIARRREPYRNPSRPPPIRDLHPSCLAAAAFAGRSAAG
jgi:hypothetical protein